MLASWIDCRCLSWHCSTWLCAPSLGMHTAPLRCIRIVCQYLHVLEGADGSCRLTLRLCQRRAEVRDGALQCLLPASASASAGVLRRAVRSLPAAAAEGLPLGWRHAAAADVPAVGSERPAEAVVVSSAGRWCGVGCCRLNAEPGQQPRLQPIGAASAAAASSCARSSAAAACAHDVCCASIELALKGSWLTNPKAGRLHPSISGCKAILRGGCQGCEASQASRDLLTCSCSGPASGGSSRAARPTASPAAVEVPGKAKPEPGD